MRQASRSAPIRECGRHGHRTASRALARFRYVVLGIRYSPQFSIGVLPNCPCKPLGVLLNLAAFFLGSLRSGGKPPFI
jgi:hypothetical protein